MFPLVATVEALGAGLMNCPETGVARLDALIRTVFDKRVTRTGQWRKGMVTVVGTAPVVLRDVAFTGFEAILPGDRGEAGEGCAAKSLERIAVDDLAVLADPLDTARAICGTSTPRARRHLRGRSTPQASSTHEHRYFSPCAFVSPSHSPTTNAETI